MVIAKTEGTSMEDSWAPHTTVRIRGLREMSFYLSSLESGRACWNLVVGAGE